MWIANTLSSFNVTPFIIQKISAVKIGLDKQSKITFQFVSVFRRLGAFLVPYIIMVLVIGLPIFFAELFVGQYSGIGPIKAYARMAPFFQGKLNCFF